MVLFMPRDAASVPVSRQVLDSCLETLGVTPLLQLEVTEGAGFQAVLALHLVSSILKSARLLAPGFVEAGAGNPDQPSSS